MKIDSLFTRFNLMDLWILIRKNSRICFLLSYSVFIFSYYILSSRLGNSIVFFILVVFFCLYATKNRATFLRVAQEYTVKLLVILFIILILHIAFVNPQISSLTYVWRAFITLLFLIISITFFFESDQLFLSKFFTLLSSVASICAIFSIILYYYKKSYLIDIRLVPIGRSENQIVAAYLYEIAGIISLYLYNTEIYWKKKVGFVLSILIIGVLILYTRSRMQIFTYLMCIFIGTIYYSRSLFRTFVSYTLVAALVAVICLHPMINVMLSDYFTSLLSRGSSFRYEIWSNVVISIFEHPLFGSGVKAKTYFRLDGVTVDAHPHNILLGTIFYFGIFVGMLFFLILCRILFCALRKDNFNKPLNVLAMILFLNCIVSSMTDNPRIVTTPPFWPMFWFPVAFVIANEIKYKLTLTQPPSA